VDGKDKIILEWMTIASKFERAHNAILNALHDVRTDTPMPLETIRAVMMAELLVRQLPDDVWAQLQKIADRRRSEP
jgi:hypothetical protein